MYIIGKVLNVNFCKSNENFLFFCFSNISPKDIFQRILDLSVSRLVARSVLLYGANRVLRVIRENTIIILNSSIG